MRFTVFWTVIKHEVDSLELRHIRCDLICVYKLLFDMVDAEVPALFVTRGHSLKLSVVYTVQQSRIDARKYFFSNRVIQSWNSLPATPDDSSSLLCFRRSLQRT